MQIGRVAAAVMAAVLMACGPSATRPDSGEPGGPNVGPASPDAGHDAGPLDDDGGAPLGDGGEQDAGRSPDGGVGTLDAGCAALPPVTAIDPSATPELAIAGDPPATFGVTDPYVWYPAGSSFGLMAYSAAPEPLGTVYTRVALSVDQGATWAFKAQANAATPLSVTTMDMSVCGATTCSGTLVHEVPTIIVDPFDPDLDRRIKLFVHSYLERPGKHHYNIGYIGSRHGDLNTRLPSDVWIRASTCRAGH